MTIAGQEGRIKGFLGRIPQEALLVLVILLTATGCFGLGVLAGRDMGEGEPLLIEERAQEALPAAAVQALDEPETPAAAPMTQGGAYVGSKSGKAYHLPWCPGAARIKEENKIYFASKEEAEAKGYTAAKNCKGI